VRLNSRELNRDLNHSRKYRVTQIEKARAVHSISFEEVSSPGAAPVREQHMKLITTSFKGQSFGHC